jgi:hypothetical protein
MNMKIVVYMERSPFLSYIVSLLISMHSILLWINVERIFVVTFINTIKPLHSHQLVALDMLMALCWMDKDLPVTRFKVNYIINLVLFNQRTVLRYCRNVHPTWVRFHSSDTKELVCRFEVLRSKRS